MLNIAKKKTIRTYFFETYQINRYKYILENCVASVNKLLVLRMKQDGDIERDVLVRVSAVKHKYVKEE